MESILSEVTVINTDNLTFVKHPSPHKETFMVSVFIKGDNKSQQYGILSFTVNPDPNVMFFKNTIYGEDDFNKEIETYKMHISKTLGVKYCTFKVNLEMPLTMEVEGFFTKQVEDKDGKPVFNEDGTPKMYNKPFHAKSN